MTWYLAYAQSSSTQKTWHFIKIPALIMLDGFKFLVFNFRGQFLVWKFVFFLKWPPIQNISGQNSTKLSKYHQTSIILPKFWNDVKILKFIDFLRRTSERRYIPPLHLHIHEEKKEEESKTLHIRRNRKYIKRWIRLDVGVFMDWTCRKIVRLWE